MMIEIRQVSLLRNLCCVAMHNADLLTVLLMFQVRQTITNPDSTFKVKGVLFKAWAQIKNFST